MADDLAEGPVPALELARAAAATVRVATFRLRLLASRVPPLRETKAGWCPQCGRALPAAIPIKPFLHNDPVPLSEAERVRLCLVDGLRARHAQPITDTEFMEAARYLEDDWRAKGWKAWAALLEGARGLADPLDAAEASGQSMELFRRYAGVEQTNPEPGSASRTPLEVLVVSSAILWPVSHSVGPK